jgi:hypothetical protein
MKHNRIASNVFMVYPASFGFDDQTAATNAFQRHLPGAKAAITDQAQMEFEQAVAILRAQGIHVTVFQDQPVPAKPNAVFSNNWLTTWPNGRVFLYPMATESRRSERSDAAQKQLSDTFRISETIDLSGSETEGAYLESTGVMVFDHAHKRAYAAISPRCDETLAREHIKSLGYQPIIFCTAGQQGDPIYHTNVLMGVQMTTAVVCAAVIADVQERQHVLDSLEDTGHEVIIISPEQMARFCGNVIELQNQAGDRFLVMSQTAYDGFTPAQRQLLSLDKTLLPLSIPTIETIGGGSARCMITEVFLPAR